MSEIYHPFEFNPTRLLGKNRAVRSSLLGASALALLLSHDSLSFASDSCEDRYDIKDNTIVFIPSVSPGSVGYDYTIPFRARIVEGRVEVIGKENTTPKVETNDRCSEFIVTFVDPSKK